MISVIIFYYCVHNKRQNSELSQLTNKVEHNHKSIWCFVFGIFCIFFNIFVFGIWCKTRLRTSYVQGHKYLKHKSSLRNQEALVLHGIV